MLDKNYGTLGQMARVCICVLRTNRTREAERDFCGLPIRRVVLWTRPWCLKGFLFSGDESSSYSWGILPGKDVIDSLATSAALLAEEADIINIPIIEQ
ncbi:hypothetical protein TNCV_709141 [Trichonephila clavipes]|nr:hypothetical protein TNCV_709141 [Trichonephila clavipes]